MSAVCQVDFYVLQDESQSAEMLACRLALMAWEKGNRIMVVAENEAQAGQLDALMWEHPQGRFVPHEMKRQTCSAPVVIGTMADLTDDVGEVVINLTRSAVPQPERFHRLLELVPANDAQREASRDKFRTYRSQGLDPASHPINRKEAGTAP